MRKWLASVDWVSILASALVLVLFLWFLAANPDYETYPAAYKNPLEYIFAWLSPEGWTATFTGVLTVSTVFLWLETRSSVDIASRALTDLERPWVFLEEIEIIDFPVADKKAGFRFRLANAGRSPAILVSLRGGAKCRLGPVDPSETGLEALSFEDLIGYAIAPGRPKTAGLTMKKIFPASLIDGVNDGRAAFVMRAIVEYVDAFGTTHETAFAAKYDHEAKAMVGCGGKAHNYTT